jgi:non-ribosomal peptide synthetase component F
LIGSIETEERSNRVAHYLLQQNVGREQPVVIYGHRSPAVVVAILAALKAGSHLFICTMLLIICFLFV